MCCGERVWDGKGREGGANEKEEEKEGRKEGRKEGGKQRQISISTSSTRLEKG